MNGKFNAQLHDELNRTKVEKNVEPTICLVMDPSLNDLQMILETKRQA
jgi:hypothetical protein